MTSCAEGERLEPSATALPVSPATQSSSSVPAHGSVVCEAYRFLRDEPVFDSEAAHDDALAVLETAAPESAAARELADLLKMARVDGSVPGAPSGPPPGWGSAFAKRFEELRRQCE